MTEKDLLIVNFLAENGLKEAERAALAGDASHRRYERITYKGNEKFMLMIAPPQKEDVRPFIKVDEILRKKGLNAPEIIAQDLANGLLLLEDFGDDLYSRVIPKGANELELYDYAVKLLGQLPTNADVPKYSEIKLLDEAALLTDWYATEASYAEYQAIWKELLSKLDNSKQVLVLRDYHADNLIWLPKQKGFMKVGLLDFQDAVIGHPAYDLVSLIEDARRDVKPEVTAAALKGRTPEFMRDYYILGAQRNCKIIGIFNRLQKRDGKDGYLKYLPRVWNHLRGDLEHPVLAPLKAWMEKYNVKEA